MRLWHQSLIPYLPRKQLLGQHRECCAIRGKGWGKKQSTVKYVFSYDPLCLYEYHLLVMREMEKRGYHPNPIWFKQSYRGKNIGFDESIKESEESIKCIAVKDTIFKEHDIAYFYSCIKNLTLKYQKGKIPQLDWDRFENGIRETGISKELIVVIGKE